MDEVVEARPPLSWARKGINKKRAREGEKEKVP
jgi:hypothetical protein